jgi:hypothetical protein
VSKLVALVCWIVVATHAIVAAPDAAATIGPAGGIGTPNPPPTGGIGIRLLDRPAPSSDPRARVYIVNHVHPGARFVRRLEVANTTSTRQRVALYAAAAALGDDTFTFAPGRTRNELTSWTSLDKPEIAMPPRSRQVVSATFDVPASAHTGERYAVIWAEVTSTQPGPTGNLRLVNRVGVRVYLHVGRGGEPPADLRIESLTPGRDGHGRPQVRAVIHNNGVRAIEVNGHLTATNERAGSAAAHESVRSDSTLAPGATAPLVAVLDKNLAGGPWKVHLALDGGSDATVAMTFPDTPGTWGLTAASKQAVAWKVGVVLGGLVLALGVLAVALIRIAPCRRPLAASRRHGRSLLERPG